METTVQRRSSQPRLVTQRGAPQGLGTALNSVPSTGSSLRPKLRRKWTMCKGGRPASGGTATNALPLPFMEISMQVLDTLDVLKNSVEEEIVFQATMQVPAHHAIACRIDAYGTPFAAPALKADPSEWSEDDKQFAACLATPPELEEAPSFGRQVSMPAPQPAPEVRTVSGGGVLTMSFSVRQRQNSDNKEEDDKVPDLDIGPLHASIKPSDRTSTVAASVRPSIAAHRMTSFSRAADAAVAAVEEEEAAAQGGESAQAEDARFSQALDRLQSRQLLRVESMNPMTRKKEHLQVEVPAGTQGVAALMGLGYMLMHHWSARTEPASGLMQHHINAFAGMEPKPGFLPSTKGIATRHTQQPHGAPPVQGRGKDGKLPSLPE